MKNEDGTFSLAVKGSFDESTELYVLDGESYIPYDSSVHGNMMYSMYTSTGKKLFYSTDGKKFAIPTPEQIRAGANLYVLGGALIADISTKDLCPAKHENYNIVISTDSALTILKRNLNAIFDNSVQSYKQETLNPITIDYIYDGYNGKNTLSQDELLDLLVQVGLWNNTDNTSNLGAYRIPLPTKWNTNAYSYKTLSVVLSESIAKNFTINDAILQLVGATVMNTVTAHEYDFKFEIKDIEDFLSIRGDAEGLKYVRQNYGIGNIPTYQQTADISAIDKNGNRIFYSPIEFSGKYLGYYLDDAGNKVSTSINGLIIVSDEDKVGLFSTLYPDSFIDSLQLFNTLIYSKNPNATVGGIAGYAAKATIINCEFNGTIVASENSTVGGIVGEISGGEISNCISSGTINGGKTGFIGALVADDANMVEKESSVSFVNTVVDGLDVASTTVRYLYYKSSEGGSKELLFSRINVYKGALYEKVYDKFLTDDATIVNRRTETYRNIGGSYTVLVYHNDIIYETYVKLPSGEIVRSESVTTNQKISLAENAGFMLHNGAFIKNLGFEVPAGEVGNLIDARDNVGMSADGISTQLEYVDIANNTATEGVIYNLKAHINNYVMVPWSRTVAGNFDLLASGTTDDPIEINNYRQLVFTILFPWLKFNIDSDMYIPKSYATDGTNPTIDNVTVLYK